MGFDQVLTTLRKGAAALSSEPSQIKSCATQLLTVWHAAARPQGAAVESSYGKVMKIGPLIHDLPIKIW